MTRGVVGLECSEMNSWSCRDEIHVEGGMEASSRQDTELEVCSPRRV
jgi:hypothetical protein